MTDQLERITTGTAGLDEVLDGGLIANRSYLVRGDPGTGKTMLGLNFLCAGLENGETSLFVNLEEAERDVRQNAAVVGMDLEDVHFLDLSPDSEMFVENQSYDIFEPSEVEQESLTDSITERIESVDPDRVFIDPMTRLRYITSDEYQFRQQVIAFTRYVKDQGATVLFTSQNTAYSTDDDLQFLTDGTIDLRNDPIGRQLTVPKFRGSDTLGGVHTMRIRDDGIHVYPEINPENHAREVPRETLSVGVPELDELLCGGIDRGTITVVTGPTGVGKTTTGSQFMKEAAGRGERSSIYMFEETKRIFLERSTAINIPVEQMIDQGTLNVTEVGSFELSPQEFAQRVKHDVEENDTSVVMIDGINGYLLSLRGDRDAHIRKLHTLCRYLRNMGITVILVEEVGSVTGEFEVTQADISYLADNIIFLRHLEVHGEMQKAIGVLKKRTGDYERTLREFSISEHGLKVGEPLTNLRNILSGQPNTIRSAEERSNG
ncbi:ATPase domain-containing protein [Natrononativus amylolyticus]|uniref:ATPase domain-containing protein n=1 Tax=Natrononativus amylolyticus TaxID=2963434 RepID=UPI0020CF5C77|nr:ATPase domain-containing protein [Natrononativus amylolyticus]